MIIKNQSIVEYSNGDKNWLLNGQLHREDGPAIERSNGSKEWFLNGRLHRLDGPAIESRILTNKWFIDGIEFSEIEFNEKIKTISKKESYVNGTVFWALPNGKLHNEFGPAIEWANGIKCWFLNGEKISEDEFNKKYKIKTSKEIDKSDKRDEEIVKINSSPCSDKIMKENFLKDKNKKKSNNLLYFKIIMASEIIKSFKVFKKETAKEKERTITLKEKVNA